MLSVTYSKWIQYDIVKKKYKEGVVFVEKLYILHKNQVAKLYNNFRRAKL